MNHYCFWEGALAIMKKLCIAKTAEKKCARLEPWGGIFYPLQVLLFDVFFFNSCQPINYPPKPSCTISLYNCTHLKLYDSWNTPQGICNVSTACINFYQQQSQTALAYGFRCYIWRVIAMQCIHVQRTLQLYQASYVTQYMQRATAMSCNVYKGKQLCHTMHAIRATAMSHNICREQQL